MQQSFASYALENGGDIFPLLIPSHQTSGTGLMNPSILNLDGKIYVNIRHVNYTFYHSEKKLFNHPFGPLTYLHPENDMHLRTWNWITELDDDFNQIRTHKIDTSAFPEAELWDFVGLEDARLVNWNGKIYTTGVRRDLDEKGTGRMELCEIEINENSVVEKSRFRIPPPNDPTSYCEKNWMPIEDEPLAYIKWSNPTERVIVDPVSQTSSTTHHTEYQPIPRDLRGGSQVVPLGDGRHFAITHEVDLFNSDSGRKDAVYRHRFLVWDKDWNLTHWTEDFSIMSGQVEFAIGMCKKNSDYLITFGYQDNAAFLLKIPEQALMEYLKC